MPHSWYCSCHRHAISAEVARQDVERELTPFGLSLDDLELHAEDLAEARTVSKFAWTGR